MIPVTQTKLIVLNSEGEMIVRGNCFAAAIASIIEKPIEEIPNVEVLFHIEGSFWMTVMLSFLNSIGWEFSTDDRFKVFHTDQTEDEEYLKNKDQCRDKFYLVTGLASRGAYHCCVFQNGKLVHDPHPSREGLTTLEYFESLEYVGLKPLK